MMGYSLNLRPPMADRNCTGNFGGFLQVDADDARLMTSQVSMFRYPYPPQMSSLEKPVKKCNNFLANLQLFLTAVPVLHSLPPTPPPLRTCF